MKKLIAAGLAAAMMSAAAAPAFAFDTVNLPPTMTVDEALEIYDASDIMSITVSDLYDDMYVELSQDEIKDLYYSFRNVELVRRINPNPFRGINVNIYTTSGEVRTFNLNSGVQLGKFGKNNYICYTMNDEDMSDYMYLDSLYRESENKIPGAEVVPRTDYDFLKLPADSWAVDSIKEAASRSLLPYELTFNYSSLISREYFCKLVGNFIAVTSGYSSIQNYMIYNDIPYDTGIFADIEGRDDSICILKALGIVDGKDGVYFDPDGVLTREEAAKIVTETARRYVYVNTSYDPKYADSREIAPWARFYVNWVSDVGVMGGVDSTHFMPKDFYTQQQAIATVSRLYNVCAN